MRGKRGGSNHSQRPTGRKGGGGVSRATGGGGRAPTDPPGDPIDFLLATHMAQLELCDRLEAIANSLPGNIDAAACHRAAMALRHEVHLHHIDEEEGLFPLLRGHAADDRTIDETIRRLEAEHAADQGFSDELIELLERLARGRRPRDQEAAGYMLRGFFQSFRRHLAFENEVIFPRARVLLNEADRESLTCTIRRHRDQAPRLLFPKEGSDGPLR